MSQITRLVGATGPGSGTVTSISAGTGITLTPNPIVATGSVALTVPVVISNGGTNSTSFSTTNGIVKYDGTRLVSSTTATLDASNRQTNTAQPAFLAYLPSTDANATGDGTAYTLGSVTAMTKVYDQGNNFNTNGIFTAPVTGRYMFTAGYAITNIGVGHTRSLFYCPATSRQATVSSTNPFTVQTSNGFVILCSAFYLDMTAGDVASMVITVFNSTKTVSVYGDGSLNTFFGGALIC